MQEYYANLPKLDDTPVYILEYHHSTMPGKYGSVDRTHIWQMCQDISYKFGWTVVPQFYCDQNSQGSCRLLMFYGATNMSTFDKRVPNEDVLKVRSFIQGWIAAYKRRPKIKSK